MELFSFYFESDYCNFFEIEESSLNLANSPLMEYLIDEYQNSIDLKPPSRYYTNNPKSKQSYSLPSTLIYTIVKSAPVYTLQKLYFVSKSLYNIRKIPICYKLDISELYNLIKFNENTLFITPKVLQTSNNLPNFHFTTTFSLQKLNPDSLQAIIPKISAMNIIELHLYYQALTLEEFLILTPKTEFLAFTRGSEVLGPDRMSIAQIINKMPKIKIAFFNPFIPIFSNNDTDENEKPRHDKTLKNFFVDIYPFMEPINISNLCQFIKKNVASKSHFKFNIYKSTPFLSSTFDDEMAKNILTSMSAMFDTWESTEQKPNLKLTLNKNDYYFS